MATTENDPIDVAREPVDLTQDDGFMDTGVLYESRACVNCGNDDAAEGYRYCSGCLEDGAMEADQAAIERNRNKT